MANIVKRYGTEAELTAANPVLASGEIAEVIDKGYVKVGDGVTAFNSLPVSNKLPRYLSAVLSDASTVITDSTDYITPVELPVSGTITSIRARTATGTCSVQFKRNGVALGTAIASTTSGVSQTVSQAVVAGDLITVDTSSASGNGLTISVEIN